MFHLNISSYKIFKHFPTNDLPNYETSWNIDQKYVHHVSMAKKTALTWMEEKLSAGCLLIWKNTVLQSVLSILTSLSFYFDNNIFCIWRSTGKETKVSSAVEGRWMGGGWGGVGGRCMTIFMIITNTTTTTIVVSEWWWCFGGGGRSVGPVISLPAALGAVMSGQFS